MRRTFLVPCSVSTFLKRIPRSYSVFKRDTCGCSVPTAGAEVGLSSHASARQRPRPATGAWNLQAAEAPSDSNDGDLEFVASPSTPPSAAAELEKIDLDDETDTPQSSFTVDSFMASKPQRIDRVLTDRFSEPSRTYFQYLIAQEAVRVNGRIARRKSQLVTQGDLIHVRFLLPAQSAARDLVPENLPLDILYEDDAILVLNKAADMVVHPAPGNWRGTLANALAHRLGKHNSDRSLAGGMSTSLERAQLDEERRRYDQVFQDARNANDPLRPGIVHRLDKGTSGVLVVAKSALAERRLQRAFALRQVYKEYLAVLAGTPRILQNGPYLVDLPIGRHASRGLEQRILSEAQGGRPARSCFELFAMRPSVVPLTLVRVRIETGRTHQIRVHARHALNAPVLGDDLYGYRAWNQRYRTRVRRPLLHAWRLGFRHPCSAEWCVFEAPPPEDFDYFTQLLNVHWTLAPSLQELREREVGNPGSNALPDRI
jgi:23S rRNA pseudouridine1911/1915/1917 synthase